MYWESWEKRTKCTNCPKILKWDKSGIVINTRVSILKCNFGNLG